MKVLYFDCFSGISGDMALGALLDLGIDHEAFRKELNKLNLEGYSLVIDKTTRNGIAGTDVNVILHEEHEHGHSHEHDHSHEHGNEHNHEDSNKQGHSHDHSHDHDHSHMHSNDKHPHAHHERNLVSIEKIIEQSTLDQEIKDFSKKVFREIARAEAKVHNKSINEVHFHEVGAIDSIVDIVGVAICIKLLGVKKIFSSPLHDGCGFIKCQHGIIPVPVPAVMEMLTGSNIPLISEDIKTELVTPTGMGIIKCMTLDFGNMPAMTIDKAGYGFGKRDTGRLNALRVVIGELSEEKGSGEDMAEEIAVLEANIDDMSPEIMGFAFEKLLKNGALDVFYTPIFMKKSRPAVMLTVLAPISLERNLADTILRETTTLGMRRSTVKRYCMNRKTIIVDTEYGEIRIKEAFMGDIHKIAPEYEDCRKIAETTGLPLAKVYDIARENYRKSRL